MWLIYAIAFVLILFPSQAFAFGPVTHFELAWQVVHTLQDPIALLSVPLSTLLTEFLLGNVVPDNVLAKNLASTPRHSHNWENAFDLLDSALNDRERAVALGYLSHLAADVVAHNLYVPALCLLKYDTSAGHVRWEVRMDRLMRKHPKEYHALSNRDVYFKYDYFLDRIIRGTIVRGRMNNRISRRVFSVAGALARPRIRQRPVKPKNQPPPEIVEISERLALNAIRSLLTELKASPVVRLDPRGRDVTRFARRQRRLLQQALREDETPREQLDEQALRLAREIIQSLSSAIPGS